MGKHVSPRRDPKDLIKFGPRIQIEVGPPIVRIPGKLRSVTSSGTTAKFSKMPALIDTGAGRTVLTPEAIEKLQLPLVNYTILSRVGGRESRVGVHVASIQFPGDQLATIEVIEVACCDLPDQPIHCLIGRDILSRWLFSYDGRSGHWEIYEEGIATWVDSPEGI